MPRYEVTLDLTTEPNEDPPSDWNWQSIIDSLYPVHVVKCVKVATEESKPHG